MTCDGRPHEREQLGDVRYVLEARTERFKSRTHDARLPTLFGLDRLLRDEADLLEVRRALLTEVR